jgi:hypothetical protein
MALYEATWTDAPAVVVGANNAGQALHFLHRDLGAERLTALDDFLEIKPDNFILVRRCGGVYEDIVAPPLKFCPQSPTRIFLASHLRSQERCVVVVEHITELPGLVLWHFDYIKEEECYYQDAVLEAWDRYGDHFSLLELDTSATGILLAYDYCLCPKQSTSFTLDERLSKRNAN